MSLVSVYSAFKVLHHQDKLRQLQEGRQIAPVHMLLVLSDTCNQSCSFCAYRMPTGFSHENFGGENPKRMMPAEKAKKILREARDVGVKAVQFTGGGEPTAHPRHPEIFGFAQEVGFETALITNGLILRDLSLYRRMSWIRVSMDAATPGTYNKVHRSNTFEKMLANLEKICQMGGECLVGTSLVATLDNLDEIPEVAVMARDLGAKYLRVTALLSTAGEDVYQGLTRAVMERIAEAKELETPDFKIIDLFGNRTENLREGSPEYSFCAHQQFVVYVGGDQKIYRCCHTAYTDHGMTGDLAKQGFLDWFHSAEKRAAYREFDARTCKFCTYSDKNRLVGYMLEEPVHRNFV